MNAHGARILLAGAATMLLCPASAQAQVADGIVLNIMRECARIDDPTARLACYDNNIRSAGGAPRPSVPGSMPAPQGGGGAAVAGNTPQGFGSESMRATRQRNAETLRETADEIRAQVVSASQREPGVYLVTLEGGAQWLFSESVPMSYSPPRPGSTIEIRRGSLGSFLLRFNNQQPVPVRRVQ